MKQYILFVIVSLLAVQLTAQSVGLGTVTPDSSAILDIASTNKGIRIPRLTSAQRDAIVSPAEGLQILNLDDYCLDIYDGDHWIKNCGQRIMGMDTMPTEWHQCSNFGGGVRSGAVAITMGDKVYMGTGKDPSYKNDFWEYDPLTDVWTQLSNFGGAARTEAIGFAVNSDSAYLGTGFNGSFLGDMWLYHKPANTWIQQEGLTGFNVSSATGLAISGKGYLIGGATSNGLSNYIFEYDPSIDAWYPIDIEIGPSGGGLKDAVAIVEGNHAFVGTGYYAPLPPPFPGVETAKFWLFNPELLYWSPVADFPGGGRVGAVAAGRKVGTGSQSGVLKDDVWEYNTFNNTWSSILYLPVSPRKDAVGFTVNGRDFICSGYDGTYKNDLWEYVPFPQGQVYEQSMPPAPIYSINDGIWKKELNKLYNINSGNVGIGTSNPSAKLDVAGNFNVSGDVIAPLKFGNTIANRKLVLWSSANNDHQYLGLGINASTMRYQVGASTDNHIFYAGTSSSTSVELMRIKGDGKVGIGTSTPTTLLDVAGTFKVGGLVTAPFKFENTNANRKLVLSEVANNDHQYNGLGSNAGILRYQVGASTDNHVFYAGTSSSTSVELMRIKGDGKVGIGTSTPTALLDVAGTFKVGGLVIAPFKFENTIGNRKIVLWESFNNDHQFLGFGINGSTLRYQVSGPSDSHIFYAATSSSASTELMRISGNGDVGVNVPSPSNRMDIHQGPARTGTHATGVPLYVTGSMLEGSNGVEFRHYNGTQGIGFGFNTIYATGSDVNQRLQLAAKGSDGDLIFKTNTIERLNIKGNGKIGINNNAPTELLNVGSFSTSSDNYIQVSSSGGNQFRSGLKLKHFNEAYGWTIYSDETINKLVFKRHAADANGVTAMTLDMVNGNMSLEGVLVSENFIAPVLLNGFANFGGEHATAAYYKDKLGIVHLRGLVNINPDPDNLVIFTLPAGYRPSTSGRLIFSGVNNNTLCRVDVNASGNVTVIAGSSGWISLDQIQFRAD